MNNQYFNIGILGYQGFVGSAIARYCKKKKINFLGVSRKNLDKSKNYKFNYLINCAIPSKRFWAKNFPHLDFNETVNKTAYFLNNFRYKKFIHISSISARVQKNTIYGLNKNKAEKLVKKSNHLIFRLASMYGPGLKKGVIIDLLNSSTVFVSKKSKYSFTNINTIAEFIVSNLSKYKNKTLEIGCGDALILGDIRKKINSKSKFVGSTDNQILKKSKFNTNFGSSSKIFDFIKKRKKLVID